MKALFRRFIHFICWLFGRPIPLTDEEKKGLNPTEIAIRQMPPRVLQKRHEDYIRFCNKHVAPVDEKMMMIEMTQPFSTRKDINRNGSTDLEAQRQVHWTKEGKKSVKRLKEYRDRMMCAAERRFWKGYEHLKPVNDE